MLDAVAPSATNTRVKPATNNPIPRRTGRSAADGVVPSLAAASSAAERPDTMER